MTLKHAILAAFLVVRVLEALAISSNTCKPVGRAQRTVKVATGWYAGYHDVYFPLSNVSWSKYTHLSYAFVGTMPNATIDLMGLNPDDISNFVVEAHSHQVKALITIGGWTGSQALSLNVGSASNRTAFVKTVTDFVQNYNADGVEFDWEYPASQLEGIGCNVVNPQDTENFLSFLQELRKSPVGSKLILTAAVTTSPFIGLNGTASTDVSGFSKVLDWITIMNYDIWGTWMSSVGPNAPLNDTCAPLQDQVSSAVSSVKRWNSAGIPKHQIILGVPAYGHSYQVPKAEAFEAGSNSVLALYPKFNSSAYPAGDAWDGTAGVDICGNQTYPGGTLRLWGMVDEGYLYPNGSVEEGIFYRYDACSQTPFVYNSTTEIMVSFDNAKSFAAKGKFIKDQGLLGFAMWEVGGDSKDILLNSIRKAVGF